MNCRWFSWEVGMHWFEMWLLERWLGPMAWF
jgi:hypothetical protein